MEAEDSEVTPSYCQCYRETQDKLKKGTYLSAMSGEDSEVMTVIENLCEKNSKMHVSGTGYRMTQEWLWV